MGILIIIIVFLLVIAGAGAGVYIFVFKAKNKKAAGNPESMGNIPTYGMGPAQQDPAPGQSFFNNNAPQPGQSAPLGSPVMNDITGQTAPVNAAPEMPQVSQPQEVSSNDMLGSQPAVNHNFPSEASGIDVPAAVGNDVQNNMPADAFEPTAAQPGSAGNFLDDSTPMPSVSEMESISNEPSLDNGNTDFTVPVTKEDESLSQVESELGEAAVSAQTEEKEEQSVVPETPVAPEPVQPEQSGTVQDFPIGDQPAENQESPSMVVPEPPAVSEFSIPAENPTPQPPVMSTTDNMGDGQDTGAQEMKI